MRTHLIITALALGMTTLTAQADGPYLADGSIANAHKVDAATASEICQTNDKYDGEFRASAIWEMLDNQTYPNTYVSSVCVNRTTGFIAFYYTADDVNGEALTPWTWDEPNNAIVIRSIKEAVPEETGPEGAYPE
jgi:hypothetical protein